MDDSIETIKMPCPKCREKVDNNAGAWKKHIKEKHKEIKKLRIGTEVINLNGTGS